MVGGGVGVGAGPGALVALMAQISALIAEGLFDPAEIITHSLAL
ncbi:hypothetical protein ACPTF1_14240 [Enterococcus faecium]